MRCTDQVTLSSLLSRGAICIPLSRVWRPTDLSLAPIVDSYRWHRHTISSMTRHGTKLSSDWLEPTLSAEHSEFQLSSLLNRTPSPTSTPGLPCSHNGSSTYCFENVRSRREKIRPEGEADVPSASPPQPTTPIPITHSVPLSLAIGSPLSALSTTVDKIAAINAKHGPFDACVLVGDVFKEESDGSEVAGISCEFSFAAGAVLVMR